MSSLLDHAFFSDTYGAEYELMLSAWGDGVLCEKELLDFQMPEAILKDFKKRYRRYPKSISLEIKDPRAVGCDYGYDGVDSALLEKLGTLKELILPDSITQLELTPELEKILRENDTLLRGSFDSFAERFAAEHGFHYRPADCVIASFETARGFESTVLTLEFRRKGDVRIKEEVSEPGTSGSNTFGGSFLHSLHGDFYIKTAEEIAGTLKPALCDAILRDGRLADFLSKARTHDWFKGKN